MIRERKFRSSKRMFGHQSGLCLVVSAGGSLGAPAVLLGGLGDLVQDELGDWVGELRCHGQQVRLGLETILISDILDLNGGAVRGGVAVGANCVLDKAYNTPPAKLSRNRQHLLLPAEWYLREHSTGDHGALGAGGAAVSGYGNAVAGLHVQVVPAVVLNDEVVLQDLCFFTGSIGAIRPVGSGESHSGKGGDDYLCDRLCVNLRWMRLT